MSPHSPGLSTLFFDKEICCVEYINKDYAIENCFRAQGIYKKTHKIKLKFNLFHVKNEKSFSEMQINFISVHTHYKNNFN